MKHTHTLVVTCAGALQMFVSPNVSFNTIYGWWVIYHTCITSNPPTRISWHHTRCRDSHPRRIEPRSGTQPTAVSQRFTVNSLDKYWEHSLIYEDVCVVFGPGPLLIWYGDTQSFQLDLSQSVAVQRKHSLSQSDAVRSKPRDAFGNAANKCTLIEMYGLMTEKHLHIHTQAHIYTHNSLSVFHTHQIQFGNHHLAAERRTGKPYWYNAHIINHLDVLLALSLYMPLKWCLAQTVRGKH